jgi:hypothetical protein
MLHYFQIDMELWYRLRYRYEIRRTYRWAFQPLSTFRPLPLHSHSLLEFPHVKKSWIRRIQESDKPEHFIIPRITRKGIRRINPSIRFMPRFLEKRFGITRFLSPFLTSPKTEVYASHHHIPRSRLHHVGIHSTGPLFLDQTSIHRDMTISASSLALSIIS